MFHVFHIPIARILFSNISKGTGLPDDSISFHRPVTPMVVVMR